MHICASFSVDNLQIAFGNIQPSQNMYYLLCKNKHDDHVTLGFGQGLEVWVNKSLGATRLQGMMAPLKKESQIFFLRAFY